MLSAECSEHVQAGTEFPIRDIGAQEEAEEEDSEAAREKERSAYESQVAGPPGAAKDLPSRLWTLVGHA